MLHDFIKSKEDVFFVVVFLSANAPAMLITFLIQIQFWPLVINFCPQTHTILTRVHLPLGVSSSNAFLTISIVLASDWRCLVRAANEPSRLGTAKAQLSKQLVQDRSLKNRAELETNFKAHVTNELSPNSDRLSLVRLMNISIKIVVESAWDTSLVYAW